MPDQIPTGSSAMAATSVSSPPSAPAQPQTVDNLSNATGAICADEINGNAARPKKPARMKPINGIIEPVTDDSWPPLSKSNMSPAKLSADSSNAVADVSTSTSQRFVKHGGGSTSTVRLPVQSTLPLPPLPPPPPFPIFEMPLGSYAVSAVPYPSRRELPFESNPWDARPTGDFGPQSHGSDQGRSSPRGSFRPHERGDASYQDVANFPNNRNGRVYHPRGSLRGLVRSSLPPITPPPMGSFVRSMGFPDLYYLPTIPLEPYRSMPFFTHGPPPAMFPPFVESPMASMLIKQIEYYFSDSNLAGDQFLKSKMDQQGWVPITLIASFRRVKSLTSDIQFILNSLRSSGIVEVNDDRVRRRTDWMKWIMPDSCELLPSQLDQTNQVATLLNVRLDETTDNSGSHPNLEARKLFN